MHSVFRASKARKQERRNNVEITNTFNLNVQLEFNQTNFEMSSCCAWIESAWICDNAADRTIFTYRKVSTNQKVMIRYWTANQWKSFNLFRWPVEPKPALEFTSLLSYWEAAQRLAVHSSFPKFCRKGCKTTAASTFKFIILAITKFGSSKQRRAAPAWCNNKVRFLNPSSGGDSDEESGVCSQPTLRNFRC